MAKLSTKVNKYFISFIEECVMNALYQDYIGGRIEVHKHDEIFSNHEIRFFTKRIKTFGVFRDRWDLKDITGKQLKYIERKVKLEFCQFPKKVRFACSGKQGVHGK